MQEVEKVFTFSPNIPVMLGGEASSRKSSLHDFTKKLMLDAKGAPDWLSQVFLTEATLKGIRTAIKKFARASASCDELSCMMSTPWSENAQGIHFLSRPKMCTFSQCEPDSVITGAGVEELTHYAMQVRAFGQCEVLEWVMRAGLSRFDMCSPSLPLLADLFFFAQLCAVRSDSQRMAKEVELHCEPTSQRCKRGYPHGLQHGYLARLARLPICGAVVKPFACVPRHLCFGYFSLRGESGQGLGR